ncbi:DUF262 domain-containing protein [Fibrella sp. WM1]|uniref:DUF262 domain-containing protein n=1 Tax=Fibrella musci TaxID=3242485 RepID=UPI003522CEBA
MQVTPSNYPIADYCRQMQNSEIIVNREYQRSDGVWPKSARSYLIETVLLGYPIPKLSLSIKTDIKTRTTRKEIVDGQQRSTAIYDFYNDKFSISVGSRSIFAGKKFSQLDEEYQLNFINYKLGVDLFSAASDADIREVFRRMNSYTVPLNPAETRYATHQGVFKWFVSDLTKKYSQSLKDLGVFSEKLLVRMNDSTLFTEITKSLIDGIFSASDVQINKFYTSRDKQFPEKDDCENRIEKIFDYLFSLNELWNTALMKPYNFYSLTLAITHHLSPVAKFQTLYNLSRPTNFDRDTLIRNLQFLSFIQNEDSNTYPDYKEFIEACSSGTNRIVQRETRFKYYCKALDPETNFI